MNTATAPLQNDTEKRSISAPANLLAEADARARARRMTNFSEYVRDLIRRDIEGKLPNQFEQKEAA